MSQFIAHNYVSVLSVQQCKSIWSLSVNFFHLFSTSCPTFHSLWASLSELYPYSVSPSHTHTCTHTRTHTCCRSDDKSCFSFLELCSFFQPCTQRGSWLGRLTASLAFVFICFKTLWAGLSCHLTTNLTAWLDCSDEPQPADRRPGLWLGQSLSKHFLL